MDVAWQNLVTIRSVHVAEQNAERTRELLARAIIEMGKIGEKRVWRLSQRALAHLQASTKITRNI